MIALLVQETEISLAFFLFSNSASSSCCLWSGILTISMASAVCVWGGGVCVWGELCGGGRGEEVEGTVQIGGQVPCEYTTYCNEYV